jgi:hypothetical protein
MRGCLMARRSVERGVRFVEVYIERQIWDNHSDLESSLHYCSGKTDNPAATLIKNRKRLQIGYNAVDKRVSVHDSQATMLHLQGLQFRELIHERHGLKERLTDQFPVCVVTEALA